MGLIRAFARRFLAPIGAGILLVVGVTTSASADDGLPAPAGYFSPESPIELDQGAETAAVTLSVGQLASPAMTWNYRIYAEESCSYPQSDWVTGLAGDEEPVVDLEPGRWSIGITQGSEVKSPETCLGPIEVWPYVDHSLVVTASVSAATCPAVGGTVSGEVFTEWEPNKQVVAQLIGGLPQVMVATWDPDTETYRYQFDDVAAGSYHVKGIVLGDPLQDGVSDTFTVTDGVCGWLDGIEVGFVDDSASTCPVGPSGFVTVAGSVSDAVQGETYTVDLWLGDRVAEGVSVADDGTFSYEFPVREDGTYLVYATLFTDGAASEPVSSEVDVALEACVVPTFADVEFTASEPTCPAGTGAVSVEGAVTDAYPDTMVRVRLLDGEGEEVQAREVELNEESSFEAIMTEVPSGTYRVEYQAVGMEDLVFGSGDVELGACPEPVKPTEKPAAKPGEQLADTGASEIALWATWSIALLGVGGALLATRKRKAQ
ncbi:LPXTG cell wall anchor domain-containing protein [Scrofimicrobium sp. R131]|uniref:LPXTG cell wall anchor domain-containing protein n=1 Tax=Scrofimicrobium appendicitidis TaxID=3079930 RepID=A0AAU7V8V1_9ACTO